MGLDPERELAGPSNGSASVSRQCELLRLPRSSHHAKPKSRSPEGFTEEERAMRTVDEEHAESSRHGARPRMRNLARHGIDFGRRHVARPVRCMGMRSTAPQPDASKPARRRPETPCLPRGKRVDFPNQAWSTDITYVPLGRGHACPSATVDRHGRYAVGWRLRGTLDADECVIRMERALGESGTPSIRDGDQGPTYAAQAYMDCLARNDVRQSMDGVKRRADDVLMERWFRDLKHNRACQTEHSNMRELRRVIAGYVERYNFRRLHSSLDYSTPAEWYFSGINEANAPAGKMGKWAA